MTSICRVLPHESGDGPANMALDEALLDSVAADPSHAVVRTYTWAVPTLSLGYFQSMAEVHADPRWRSPPVVRRPTGGGALWHDVELTYAVIIPSTHPASRPSSTLYQTIHGAIAEHLRAIGIGARRRGPSSHAESSTIRPFLCFSDRDADDIVLGGVKIVGSAQRRRAGAVLQHGSLLLGRSATTPELPGLADLAAIPRDPMAWVEPLAGAVTRALDLPARVDEPTQAERGRAESLRREVYDDPSWTNRR